MGRALYVAFLMWSTCPTSNAGMQNGSSVGICTQCKHVFARFGADLHAQSVLSNKISAAELRRKLIKSALLVGGVGGCRERQLN